jgi:release factor glutamine methyltransferase
MVPEFDLSVVAAELRAAGCVAAEEEARELVEAADGDGDRLAALLDRRRVGVPLAWLTGSVRFAGHTVLVHPEVYVPRWQSEPLALEALDRLPEGGTAVDLCTGSGAIAVVLARGRPTARVLATDIDPAAVRCARANGVETFEGDMASPLPDGLAARVDVVCAVVPYVPTGELPRLPRDVLTYEPRRALDGGDDGARFLLRAVAAARVLLRTGGSLLAELGADQADRLSGALAAGGFGDVSVITDEDGDPRALYCRR